MAVKKNVYKEEVSKITIPSIAQREDRGLKLCKDPFLVLADVLDSTYWKNDRTGLAFKVDTLTVELEDENGNLETAPGLPVNFPFQSDAKGFVIDWRQLIKSGGGLKTGCYKIKVSFIKSGIEGNFYYGSYKLLPYSTHTSEGQARIFVVLDDYVRTDGINYKNSGFATTVRFKGKFGYMQPNVEIENLTKVNRIREKIRNEALRTYELRTDYVLSCLTQKIDNEHLLAANQIYLSDYNKDNHVEYKDLPVILDDNQTYEYNYSEGTPYASIRGYFLDKRAYYESKYDGDIQGAENIILDLPQGVVGGACAEGTVNVQKSDGVLISAVTAPSGGTEPYNVADSVITVNSATFASVKATDSLNVPVVDSNGDAVATTVVGSNVQVDDLPCTGGASVGATLMKTGQTTSYRTGDDGDIQAGRDVSFFILPSNNPFGNTQRFTGITGGYYDQSLSGYYDKDGVATTEALAFPNDIAMDWSTFNGATCLGYGRFANQIDISWNDAIDEALTLSIGAYVTGWRMCNFHEVMNACSFSLSTFFRYTVIDWYNMSGGIRFWCSNSLNVNSAFEFDRRYPFTYAPLKTTSSVRRYVYCRTFTVTGTTLT